MEDPTIEDSHDGDPYVAVIVVICWICATIASGENAIKLNKLDTVPQPLPINVKMQSTVRNVGLTAFSVSKGFSIASHFLIQQQT